jgi:tape measure domain-containing protein
MTATKDTSPAATKVSPKFSQEVEALVQAHARFAAGELSSVEFKDIRESHLAIALQELASAFGVTLELPLQIDSRGEYRIVAMPKDGSSAKYGTGPFGEFAAILNQHAPRTGISATALCPENGWCYMNHFEVEKMVLAQSGILPGPETQTTPG